MKFQRTSKGATIELSDEECETLKEEAAFAKYSYQNPEPWFPLLKAIHSELDEYFGENNE